MSKPKVFIASPLFNRPQIEIIERIESILEIKGFPYYSARKHSGSDKMTPEQRQDFNAWTPVFDSNVKGLDDSLFCIAVLSYAMPEGQVLTLNKQKEVLRNGGVCVEWSQDILELPDAGTVWECGYMRSQNKVVIGFLPNESSKLNLMLSHGCDGVLEGWDALIKFVTSDFGLYSDCEVMQRIMNRNPIHFGTLSNLHHFDFSACRNYNSKKGEVE